MGCVIGYISSYQAWSYAPLLPSPAFPFAHNKYHTHAHKTLKTLNVDLLVDSIIAVKVSRDKSR